MTRSEPTPLEEAIARVMRRNDPHAPEVAEHDAAGVARLLVRHWGDQAPDVLRRATELAAAEVRRWTPDPPETADAGAMDPEGGAGQW
jgi:hypothetical protein